MQSNSDSSVMVIVERAAACPDWMDHWGVPPEGGWMALEQDDREPNAAFAHRLGLGFRALRAGATILLVASDEADDAAVHQRWTLATNAMRRLAQLEGGRLVLTRGFGHDGKTDEALATLAEDLAEAWRDAEVAVEIRLEESAPVSVIRHAIPAGDHLEIAAA